MISFPRAAALAAVAILYAAMPAFGESVEDFYKGKRLTLYIGSAAGGGTDLYARTVARYMGDHLPGKPTITPVNMPGANGLIVMNNLYNTMPRDGTVFGTFDRYLALGAIAGNPQAKFDPQKLLWIGSTNVDVSTCVTWHTTGITTVHDFMTKNVVVGSSAAYHLNILNNFLGGNIKPVLGYSGADQINLAMERGEVQGRCHWSWSGVVSTRPEWIRDKKINVIMQWADEKHPDLPDVPLAKELARTDEQREIIDLIQSSQIMARPYAAPQDLPAERIEALRAAFLATLKDPELLESAKKVSLEIEPVPGKKIQDVLNQLSKIPQEVLTKFREQVMPR
jgi:tripartite-type tricarboxylate transporter receptor subunit TctC